MAEKIITPTFRGAYVGLFKATAPKDNPNGKKKYQIRAAFPPDADLSQMRKEAQAAANEKWGDGKVPKTIRSPFRTNDELENPIAGVGDDWVIVTFSATEERRPGVVDASLNDIIDESECYSGAWYRAQVRAYAYDNAGNKGVSFGLENVQKMKEGDPLGGRIPASKAFDAVPGANNPAKKMFE